MFLSAVASIFNSITDHLKLRLPNLIFSGPLRVKSVHELHRLFKLVAGRYLYNVFKQLGNGEFVQPGIQDTESRSKMDLWRSEETQRAWKTAGGYSSTLY